MDAPVAGVVLAAGASTRLGQPKQLLPLAGRPLLAHVLAAAEASPLDPLLLVLGHEAEAVLAAVAPGRARVLLNLAYAEGQSTSVRLAVAALPAQVAAAVFLLGDQPAVSPEVVARLVAAFRTRGAPIVQPRYTQGPGNPVLIARTFFPELLALSGDTGARPLLRRHAERLLLVDVGEYQRPADVDTWEEYERLRRAWEG